MTDADRAGYLYLRNRGYRHEEALWLMRLSQDHPNSEELHARWLDGVILTRETGLDRL